MSERTQDTSELPVWLKTVSISVWFIPLFLSIVAPDLIDFSTWTEITISGISMGLLIFTMAIGLTVIFGLMDVLNFAHGTFFTVGAFVSWKLFNTLLIEWVEVEDFWLNIAAMACGILLSGSVTFVMGILMEKVIIRKNYGDHLRQILITMGVMVIIEELTRIFGSPDTEAFITPAWFMESFEYGPFFVIRYQILSILLGLLIFVLVLWTLAKTKLGLIVRAGVENPSMVKAMGYNLNKVFTGVFAVGAMLAGIGGLLWAGFDENVDASMGSSNLIFAFIVVIIGGLGSVTGSLVGAVMVGLSFNYVAFFAPHFASISLVGLMCIILLLKPSGLFPQK